MRLIPAIDLRGGRCVRLLRGDFDRETRYEIDPTSLAVRYARLGATWLHVVDLDGAAQGEPVNLGVIAAVSETAGVSVQMGGGLRSRENVVRALAVVKRVVIGSVAVTRPQETEAWLGEFGPERVTLALDVRLDAQATPFLTTHAWREPTQLSLWDALSRYRSAGLRHVLCTDVDRDGALEGPNLELYAECVSRWPEIEFQASGGVRDAGDLAALASLGVAGAVSGKALLEGRITDEEIRSFLPSA